MAAKRERLEPLRVHADVNGPVALPDGGLMLDALFIYQIAREHGLVCLDSSMIVPIEAPIAREPDGRFYLCSAGMADEVASELQRTNRRPIVAEAQMHGDGKLRRLNITLGANKGYRIPRPVAYLDDGVTWWCIGDRVEIERLLCGVTHLGKRRGVGLGRVETWTVEPCEPWPGFPVVRDGKALRRLPVGWPGVDSGRCGFGTLLPPYWDHAKEEPCILP
jgi:CRISPR type IV-associated protein Csf3